LKYYIFTDNFVRIRTYVIQNNLSLPARVTTFIRI